MLSCAVLGLLLSSGIDMGASFTEKPSRQEVAEEECMGAYKWGLTVVLWLMAVIVMGAQQGP